MLWPGPCRPGPQASWMFLLPRKSQAVLDLRPVLQLEGDVMHLGARAAHEIDRVMVRTAAHEGEPVLDPVRQPEAEHAAVVFDELLGLVDAERQMAELERADAGDRLVLGDRRLLGEHVDLGALRILERHGLRECPARCRCATRSARPRLRDPCGCRRTRCPDRPGTTAWCSAPDRPSRAAPRGRRPWSPDAPGRSPARRPQGPRPA